MARLDERLLALRAEYDKGEHELQLLERSRQELRDTLLRISGAMLVLQELLAEDAR
jgi:hypothetical protein